MDTIHNDGPLDPRHVFLHASDVMHRCGQGKIKGYQNLKDRDVVPAPVTIHPDHWRAETVTDLLPPAKAPIGAGLAPR